MVEQSGQAFRPRARLLQLLGDQLIGSPRLALFELVKNAYDAGATKAKVTMLDLDGPSAKIRVWDDGEGMSELTLREIWLVPGHDHREVERAEGPSDTRKRLPLGEKGLGRFAVHKLGNRIELVTRSRNGAEHQIVIDWNEITDHEFLDQALVEIVTRKPSVFKDELHGTQITISELRGEPWTRGEVRRLARQITSISSPFVERVDQFQATIEVPGQPSWLKDLPTIQDLIDRAPWRFDFEIVNNHFSWTYVFHGIKGVGAAARSETDQRDGVLIDPAYLPRNETDEMETGKKPRKVISPPDFADGIGPIRGTLFVFDRDREVLLKMGDSQGLQKLLDENGGVRVYRDGMRVYNYGEASDDWLGLDLRRVNSPTKRISRNIVIGSIDLSLANSPALREKTNREGFDDNNAYSRLRALVVGAIATFEDERNEDKNAIRRILTKAKDESDIDIARPLSKLRQIAKKNNLSGELDPLIEAAQRSYDDMREIMLRSGTSNMTLVIVFHEIDHGVRLLHQAILNGASLDAVLPQTKDLLGLLDGFGDLLKKGDMQRHDLSKLVERVVDLNKIRLRNHGIELVAEFASAATTPFSVFPLGLVLGAITNVIDNSVYWLRTKWIDGTDRQPWRKLYIGIDSTNFDGPAVIVADNGPGFVDDLGDVTRPFFSRRPDGIGVGLYYVNLIMEMSGGHLEMTTAGDVGIANEYDGAALALVFKGV